MPLEPRATAASLIRYGLTKATSPDPRLDRHRVRRDAIKAIDFFRVLDAATTSVLDRHRSEHGLLSYTIWGGLAANLVLRLIARCSVHYTIHDVELLVTKNARIYFDDRVLRSLQRAFTSSPELRLGIGGVATSERAHGTSVDDFQIRRANLADGDLLLNRLAIIVNRRRGDVMVDSPSGLLQRLVAGESRLDVAEAGDLRSLDRIARRVYRLVAKVIRFDLVAGLTLSRQATRTLTGLLDRYMAGVAGRDGPQMCYQPARARTSRAASDTAVAAFPHGPLWLLQRVVSESTMRIAGLHGIGRRDRSMFLQFVHGEPRRLGVLRHPLIRAVARRLGVPHVLRSRRAVDALARRCYADFRRYQIDGAETLRGRYSISVT